MAGPVEELLEAPEQCLSYKMVPNLFGISLSYMMLAYIRTVYDKLQINPKAELLGRKCHT